MFLFDYGEQQMGGRRPELSTLPLNYLITSTILLTLSSIKTFMIFLTVAW